MSWYIHWVSNNPLFSAAVQFAFLGTFGEYLSNIVRRKKVSLPFNLRQLLGKLLAWALLGIIIKYGFVGMKGFVRGLLDQHLLPGVVSIGLGWAFAVSVFMNILFGPQMMLFHRIEENLLMKRWDFSGLKTAWFTLVWFWIPAHTVTFSLPKDYQIGLAALWSVVLGVIMGLTAPEKKQ
jgi:hypothetical protein